ncbi:hypothetical protein TNCV_185871 [Trichonephila clavipes]|nr:hypothetical protein TNCV_185871 [Trichonephila clavipes]
MAPWPRAPVIPQLVDRKTFRDNRWVRHLSLTSWRKGNEIQDENSVRVVLLNNISLYEESDSKSLNKEYNRNPAVR